MYEIELILVPYFYFSVARGHKEMKMMKIVVGEIKGMTLF